MASNRDPRVDPMSGDVLGKKWGFRFFEVRAGLNERKVDEVEDGRVVYVGDTVCSPSIALASWRKWAATAEIIHRAEDPADAR